MYDTIDARETATQNDLDVLSYTGRRLMRRAALRYTQQPPNLRDAAQCALDTGQVCVGDDLPTQPRYTMEALVLKDAVEATGGIEDDSWLNDVVPLQPRPIQKEQSSNADTLTCWF